MLFVLGIFVYRTAKRVDGLIWRERERFEETTASRRIAHVSSFDYLTH